MHELLGNGAAMVACELDGARWRGARRLCSCAGRERGEARQRSANADKRGMAAASRNFIACIGLTGGADSDAVEPN